MYYYNVYTIYNIIIYIITSVYSTVYITIIPITIYYCNNIITTQNYYIESIILINYNI